MFQSGKDTCRCHGQETLSVIVRVGRDGHRAVGTVVFEASGGRIFRAPRSASQVCGVAASQSSAKSSALGKRLARRGLRS